MCGTPTFHTFIAIAKGHEPKLYEALGVIVGLLLTIYIVNMKGPNNKQLNDKYNLWWLWWNKLLDLNLNFTMYKINNDVHLILKNWFSQKIWPKNNNRPEKVFYIIFSLSALANITIWKTIIFSTRLSNYFSRKIQFSSIILWRPNQLEIMLQKNGKTLELPGFKIVVNIDLFPFKMDLFKEFNFDLKE